MLTNQDNTTVLDGRDQCQKSVAAGLTVKSVS